MPVFSVIIPVYNRHHLLTRAVDSVIKQTFPNWECCIIDDGSSVPDPRFVEPTNLNKVHYHYFSRNRGVSWARNQGFRRSSGEWIAFLDSDDEWLPQKLARTKTYIETHPDTKIFQSDEIWMRKGKRVNPPAYLRKQGGDIFLPSLERCLITTSSVVIHRSLLEEERWDETLPTCEDYDLWLRLTSRHQVGLLDTPLTIRYQDYGEEQLSQKYPIMDRYRLQSLKKLIKRLRGNDDKKQLVEEVLMKKAGIVFAGARKRKKIMLRIKIFFQYFLWYYLHRYNCWGSRSPQ